MSCNVITPNGYKSVLDLKQTEKAIKLIKDFFQLNLSAELRLTRVTAPLFVLKGTGINDDLNGSEMPVSFSIKNMNGSVAEVVQSLAKWKRMMLADYNIEHGYGIYTDMNAVRPDEILDNLHSLYVDQWDWERVISEQERNPDFLKYIVRKIYSVIYKTESFIYENYYQIKPFLPEEITFIHSEELYELYPGIPPFERENKVVEKYGAVFIIGIGGMLPDGNPHDGRAPDYDDWTSKTNNGYKGLNGDIIVWNPVLKRAYEISSMGIRVNKEALLNQLEITGTEIRKELLFHRRLLNGELPLSIGGGIGQSRLCMYFLRKAHIGEIQSSIWPIEMIDVCKKNNIFLL
ncbi:MAG: aspartate--ammonia ligase [Bacteroidia bacterium]|nr:aspartate--ammonia ligase [Bacteroidia bacterium]